MNYSGMSIEEELKDLEEKLGFLVQQRARGIKPISPEAEIAHQEVLEKINRVLTQGIERKVFTKRDTSSIGCLVEVEGTTHILVHKDLANFYPSLSFHVFKSENSPKPKPRDYFQNIVAHEYGHILLSERLSKRLSYEFTSYANPFWIVSQEFDEAFAFAFGDRITNLNSPLDELAFGYSKKGLDFEKTKRAYGDLVSLRGVSEMLETQKLVPILKDIM